MLPPIDKYEVLSIKDIVLKPLIHFCAKRLRQLSRIAAVNVESKQQLDLKPTEQCPSHVTMSAGGSDGSPGVS